MSQKRVPSIKQVDDDALTQELLVGLAVSADSDDIQMLVEDEVGLNPTDPVQTPIGALRHDSS